MSMTAQIRMRMANKDKGAGIKAEGDVIWLYDAIASNRDEAYWFGGVAPEDFIEALASTSGPVTLRVNSPGGSVFGAQAMVAAMRSHGQPITARSDALAASAASVIAAECATCVMVPGSMMMIHKAWGVAIGNADDMRSYVDLLEKIDGQIAAAYARRSKGDEEEYMGLMAAETWFTAEEAVAAGLADLVADENLQRPAARWDLSAYAKAPALPAPEAEPEAEPAPVLTEIHDLAAVQAARVRKLSARLRLAEPI